MIVLEPIKEVKLHSKATEKTPRENILSWNFNPN